jgi:hypothetical protein
MQSEKIVIESPLSFTGSAKRLWRLSDSALMQWLVLLPVILFAWSFILCWYAVFGVLVIPWRLIRRGQRKQRQEALRHAELLAIARQ